LNERCGDILEVLLAAAPMDADVAVAVRDGMQRHRDEALLLGRRLAELGALPPDTTAEEGATAFALMTSPAGWRQLTGDAGWSFDRAEAWLVRSLSGLLLDPAPVSPATPPAAAPARS